MPLHILMAMPGADLDTWRAALHARLPGAAVRAWEPGDSGPADYVLYWNADPAALASRNGVRAVFNMGAGVDVLIAVLEQHPESVAHRVPIVRLEDAGMARQMVQYATYCALRYQRRFPDYEESARRRVWQPLDAHPVETFVIGVLGAGALGLPVARALAALGFPVRLFSRSPKQVPGIETFAGADRFEAFVSGAWLLINLLPNTPETQGVLSQRAFDLMHPGGFVVNLARGAHLVEHDLVAALDSGQLRAAALDVFSTEPLPPEHPFWRHPRIEITPHISARTTVDQSADQVADHIRRDQRGEPLPSIDLTRGY